MKIGSFLLALPKAMISLGLFTKITLGIYLDFRVQEK